MSKPKYKIPVSITFIIIAALILSGCSSKTDHDSDNKVLLTGEVIIPGINDSASPAEGNTNNTDTGLDNTTVKDDIYTVPLQTANFKTDEYIIKFTRSVRKNYIREKMLKAGGKVLAKISNKIYKIKIDDSDNSKLINELQNNSLVSYIEREQLVHIQTVPNDPAFDQQWNLSMLGLEHTWESIRGDRSVTVAVVDSGILPDHPDLRNNIVAGYDFIDDNDDPVDDSPEFSHGTHVAGIIGAVTDNNEGVAGINWDISIMPVRVIGSEGSGGYSALISGIYWAVENGADIINLSLAGSTDSTALKEAVQYAVDNGVTVVAAAGNNGTSPVLYPARYPEVLSVGAVGPDGERAYYSNYGPGLDLVAPGGDDSVMDKSNNTILSTAGYIESNNNPVHQYTWAQGTSMAAPHVSGLVALLYSNGIDNPESVIQLLKETADDLGMSGEDNYYGAGLININRTLQLDNGDDSGDFDNKGPFDFSQIKIIARSEKNEKSIITPDNDGQFSLSLPEGTWDIIALIDSNDNNKTDRDESYKKYSVEIPETDHLVIEF